MNREHEHLDVEAIDLGDVADQTNGVLSTGIPDEFNDLARVSGGISAE